METKEWYNVKRKIWQINEKCNNKVGIWSTEKYKNICNLEQLNKLTSGPISPAGILGDDGSTHRTGGVSVKPSGHTILTEDVLAVEHHGFLVIILTYWTVTSSFLHLIIARSFPVTENHTIWYSALLLEGNAYLVDCINLENASLQSFIILTNIFPFTTM